MIADPVQLGYEYRDVDFKSIDGLNLHGWWFPARQESKAIVIFLHGNGENISSHFAAVSWLTEYNYDVFIFDYRGYGASQGEPDLDWVVTDIFQAFDYVDGMNEWKLPVFLIGQSLGASMGIYTLSEKPHNIRAAIFISPFSDYRGIVRHVLSRSWLTWLLQWPLSYTVSNRYRPLDYVSQLPPVPILYLYSKEDRVIPAEQVLSLYRNTSPPKYIEQVKGGHSDIMGLDYNRKIVLRYLQQWLKKSNDPLSLHNPAGLSAIAAPVARLSAPD